LVLGEISHWGLVSQRRDGEAEVTCKLCGLEHRGWISCAKAKADLDALKVAALRVIHADLIADTLGSSPDVDGSSRHGVYKDQEARKAYRREWMKQRRAKAPNP
jgi:hypothetical protein